MSAERLRQAAALLRERAEAADAESKRDASDFEEYALSKVMPRMPAVSAYIATMHPGVALAVADLLDLAALLWEHGKSPGPLVMEHVLAVADAALGGER